MYPWTTAQGALPYQHIRSLMDDGRVLGGKKEHLQPSSLDLSLSDEIYRMRGTYLPRIGERVRDLIAHGALYRTTFAQPLELNGIYLCRLNEALVLPQEIGGSANNKSSSGRVNLRARLLADGVQAFDHVPHGYAGELWAEIVPRSFPVKLLPGEQLNQLRFFTTDMRLSAEAHRQTRIAQRLLCDANGNSVLSVGGKDAGLAMTVDLSGHEIVGYRSAATTCRVLDFSRRDHDTEDFFTPILRNNEQEIILRRDEFYILSTKEGIRVPPMFAVEMVPYDVGKGEFRSHYAGFFDPGFGYGAQGELSGMCAVLEVFPQDNDVVLRDGQPVCTMVYEHVAELPEVTYGDARLGSNYSAQRGPRLSKHFAQ